jgi:hypothetical protein
MRKQKSTSPDSRSFTPGHRYPGLHGKVVDWVEHKFEGGLLYLHVRFTEKTELCQRISTRTTIEEADLKRALGSGILLCYGATKSRGINSSSIHKKQEWR